jgi:predicted lipoprotein with Yx(FWY)xxD motif
VEYPGNINAPDIYAQRIDPQGNIIWGLRAMAVCRAPDIQRNPDIAVNGEFIIAWEDSGGGNYDIYAQKLSRDGKIAWVCDGVPVCVAPFTQHEPKLVANGDGGATVVWEDYRRGNWDVFSQRIDMNGNLAWSKDGVSVCRTAGTQYAPHLIKSKDMSSIIAWEDYRNNKSYGIYAQRLSVDGKSIWDEDGIPVCVTEGGARGPQLVDDGEGGVVIVWTDFRFGSYDIFAQRINEEKTK